MSHSNLVTPVTIPHRKVYEAQRKRSRVGLREQIAMSYDAAQDRIEDGLVFLWTRFVFYRLQRSTFALWTVTEIHCNSSVEMTHRPTGGLAMELDPPANGKHIFCFNLRPLASVHLQKWTIVAWRRQEQVPG